MQTPRLLPLLLILASAASVGCAGRTAAPSRDVLVATRIVEVRVA